MYKHQNTNSYFSKKVIANVTFLSVEFHEPLTMCESNKTKTHANEMYKMYEMYEKYVPLRALI